MADLPPEFGFGLVTGGFQLAVGDRDDAGRHPDAIPDTGTVTFRPQAARIVIPGRRIVTPRAIETKLDAAGYLYLPESVEPDPDTGLVAEEDRGVYLVANDTQDATPQDWTYEVTVSLTGQSQWRFPIAVTSGSVQDISDLVPVDSSGGTPIIRGPEGEPGADGIMASIVAGDGIAVDSGDPANPIVSVADTGLRDVSHLLQTGWTGTVTVHRVGPAVHVTGDGITSAAGAGFNVVSLPNGFLPARPAPGAGTLTGSAIPVAAVVSASGGTDNSLLRADPGAGWDGGRFAIAFTTADPWPTTLPGVGV